MGEHIEGRPRPRSRPDRVGSPLALEVAACRDALARVSPGGLPDAARVDLLAELERLKSSAAALQAQVAAAMAADAAAVARARHGADRGASALAVSSVAGQVGLARRVSPHRAQSLVGLARALTQELPRTLAALAAGEISEWQAMVVARETAVLAATDRIAVDQRLAPALGRLGDRALGREAHRLADLVDPGASARRVRQAEEQRRVTVRPAPGPAGCAMARLSATMPVAQAVGAYAALRRHAEAERGRGDARSLGQLMSDALFTRLTGSSAAAPAVSVEVGLVMSERTLLRRGSDPALLTDDQGCAVAHVPAVLARALVRDADRAWLSRLYAAPATGELVAMDARRRTFAGRLRQLLVWRDQTCRMPWCEAPIRHADHVRPHAAGGPTGLTNGAGLCQACNYRKESPGWRAEVIDTGGHVIEFITPTGHRYRSSPPRAPGQHPPSAEEVIERARDDWDDDVDGTAPDAA